MGIKVALSAKLAAGKLVVVENLNLDSHKTRGFYKLMRKFQWKKPLLVDGMTIGRNLELATFALKNVIVLPQRGVNVYNMLQQEELVMTKESIEYLQNRLLPKPMEKPTLTSTTTTTTQQAELIAEKM
jgi:large subunit ribosomal protein L4